MQHPSRSALWAAFAASFATLSPACAEETRLGGAPPELVPPPNPGKAAPQEKPAKRPYRIGRKKRADDPLGYWEYFRKNPGSFGFWGIVGTGGYRPASLGVFGIVGSSPSPRSFGVFGQDLGPGAHRGASMGAFGAVGKRASRREYGMFGRDGTRLGDVELGLFGRSGSKPLACEDGLFGRPASFRERVRGITRSMGLFGVKDASAGHDNGIFGKAVSKKEGLKRTFSMNGLGTEGKPKAFDAGELGIEKARGAVRSTMGTMGQEVDAGTPEPEGLFGMRASDPDRADGVKEPATPSAGSPVPTPIDPALRERLAVIARRSVLQRGTTQRDEKRKDPE